MNALQLARYNMNAARNTYLDAKTMAGVANRAHHKQGYWLSRCNEAKIVLKWHCGVVAELLYSKDYERGKLACSAGALCGTKMSEAFCAGYGDQYADEQSQGAI